MNETVGDGDLPFALVDLRDIGKYVARIVADPRTLNRMVFAYGEMWTQKQIFDTLEEKSDEKIVNNRVSHVASQDSMALEWFSCLVTDKDIS